jgi:hypothetical protein
MGLGESVIYSGEVISKRVKTLGLEAENGIVILNARQNLDTHETHFHRCLLRRHNE